MKKNLVAVVLCMMLGLSVVSCGKKEDKDADLTPSPTAADPSPTPEITPEPTPETTPTPIPEEESKDENKATIDGTKYSSKSYGFEVTAPDDYVVYDEDTSMNIIYQSMSALYDSVDSMLTAFESVGIKYPFVAVTSNPVSETASANIIVQLCPSSVLPGTLEDVVKQSLESSTQQYSALGITPTMGEPKSISVDGNDVCVADSSVYIDGDFAGVTYEDFTLYQRYVCFDSGSNRILMNCTYYNEEEGKAIDTMIDTIRILK